jgi:hypothetical protein
MTDLLLIRYWWRPWMNVDTGEVDFLPWYRWPGQRRYPYKRRWIKEDNIKKAQLEYFNFKDD